MRIHPLIWVVDTDHQETLWLKLTVDSKDANAKNSHQFESFQQQDQRKVGQAIDDLTEIFPRLFWKIKAYIFFYLEYMPNVNVKYAR